MTSPAGSYVTSYDTGSKPFKHDSTRGKWSSDWDFYLACISHAFGLANFSLLPVFIMMHGGVFFIVPYTISLCLFTLPIFFIQSFLGQFSSTGFISVYRISPLFKGIGYVILILNMVSACVNSVTAAYVLTYFFASFSIDLPWMSCNNTWNSPNCSEVFQNVTGTSMDFYDMSWSTAEYFEFKILNFDSIPTFSYNHQNVSTRMAWPILGSNIVIWIILGLILFKGMESVTKYIKYSSVAIFSLLVVLFLRFLCLPGSLEGVAKFLTPTVSSILQVESWILAPFLTVTSFGSGWGTVLTMASFNRFKADITRSTLVIPIALLIAGVMSSVSVLLVDRYLDDHFNFDMLYHHHHEFNFMFVGFPYLFGKIEASQMWSLMFYLMLTLCELNALVIVIFTTVTSLFDEYEYLRIYKREICIGLPGVLFLCSTVFTTNHGYVIYDMVLRMCGIAQMEICFLELMIVVWIYGRQRFQRDLQFMLCKTFETWKFYLLRFITPIFTLFVILLNMVVIVLESRIVTFGAFLVLVAMKYLPWIFIPGYIIIKLISASGSIKARLRSCIRPNDWYPVDPCDRQRYEEALGNFEISHNLLNSSESVEEQSIN